MLVSRTAAETVDIDASWMSAIPIVHGPVAADQEARVLPSAQDGITSPDAFHATNS